MVYRKHSTHFPVLRTMPFCCFWVSLQALCQISRDLIAIPDCDDQANHVGSGRTSDSEIQWSVWRGLEQFRRRSHSQSGTPQLQIGYRQI